MASNLVLRVYLALALLFFHLKNVEADCDINLGLATSDVTCGWSCQTCTFSLTDGAMYNGTMTCLSAKPCFVNVNTAIHFALATSTLDARLASSLMATTSGSGHFIWQNANIKTPKNGNDAVFENSADMAVYNTNFYAEDSGHVQIKFVHTDALYELMCMTVDARTAQKLTVDLGPNTAHGGCQNVIRCPTQQSTEQSCVWKSDCGKRLHTQSVDIYSQSNTRENTKVICKNSDACGNVRVHCNLDAENDDDEGDWCEMQYSSSHWHCHAVNGLCAVGTSLNSTLTTEQIFDYNFSSTEATPKKKKDNKFCVWVVCDVLLYVVFGVLLFCGHLIVYYFWRRRKKSKERMKKSEPGAADFKPMSLEEMKTDSIIGELPSLRDMDPLIDSQSGLPPNNVAVDDSDDDDYKQRPPPPVRPLPPVRPRTQKPRPPPPKRNEGEMANGWLPDEGEDDETDEEFYDHMDHGVSAGFTQQ